jgi:ribosome maturation factor RimP
MISAKTIEQIVTDKIIGSHMYLVEATVSAANAINVFVDSEEAVTLIDCMELSKHIEAQLDRDVEDFELSVSSAGLSEPFKVARQYAKNINKLVEIVGKDGQKRVGTLLSHSNSGIEAEFIKKEKPEGAKRKIDVAFKEQIPFEAIKLVRLHIII